MPSSLHLYTFGESIAPTSREVLFTLHYILCITLYILYYIIFIVVVIYILVLNISLANMAKIGNFTLTLISLLLSYLKKDSLPLYLITCISWWKWPCSSLCTMWGLTHHLLCFWKTAANCCCCCLRLSLLFLIKYLLLLVSSNTLSCYMQPF